MTPQLCTKIDNCQKIDMIKDHDMLDFQFKESVKEVCGRCGEFTTAKILSGVYNLFDPQNPGARFEIELEENRIISMKDVS